MFRKIINRIKVKLSDLHITIWAIDFFEGNDSHSFHTIYFFTEKGAYKFMQKHEEYWEKHNTFMCYGGEPVFFFDFDKTEG